MKLICNPVIVPVTEGRNGWSYGVCKVAYQSKNGKNRFFGGKLLYETQLLEQCKNISSSDTQVFEIDFPVHISFDFDNDVCFISVRQDGTRH